MSIQQTKKQSDLEKRLKILRQQVYGRGSDQLRKTQITSKSEGQNFRYTDSPISSGTPSTSESFRTDLTYLNQDLTKIFILATAALGAQIILFYLVQNNILNLNLF